MTLAIIGLGRAGATNATVRDRFGNAAYRNHLSGAMAASLRIAAFVDPEVERRDAAMVAWRMQGTGMQADSEAPVLCADPGQLPTGLADIIVIASPASLRLDHFRHALACRPKLILLEKPCAERLDEGREIAAAAEAAGIPVFTNFNRRCDPGIVRWRAEWADCEPAAVVMRYSKGLLNYASHLIDHLIDWFGFPGWVAASPTALGQGSAALPSLDDLVRSDHNISFQLGYGTFTAHVLAIDGVAYDMFEADIYTSDGLHSFRNNGAEKVHYGLVADQYYPGYAGLEARSTIHAPIGGYREIYVALQAFLSGERAVPPVCPLADAIAGLEILDAVRASFLSRGEPVIFNHTCFRAEAGQQCA